MCVCARGVSQVILSIQVFPCQRLVNVNADLEYGTVLELEFFARKNFEILTTRIACNFLLYSIKEISKFEGIII